MLDSHYERVKDLLPRDEFEAQVRAEMEAWGGLLEEDTAALLVVDALGRNEVAFRHVEDLYEGGDALLRVRVDSVEEVRTFSRKDGSEGRVINLTVSDDTGDVRLALWDEEVDLVLGGTVGVGSRIRIIDGYVRRGPFGLEVSSGKWGVVLPEEGQRPG